MENVNESLRDVVDCIKTSKEYKSCILLKEKMNSNEEILHLINRIKSLQKQYIRNNYDSALKEELESVLSELSNIPIYSVYMQNLEKVNQKIDYVKDELNDYFYHLLNDNEL